jgi:nucleoside-diphosphate-sugar epimerase
MRGSGNSFFISPAGTDLGARQGVPLMEAKFKFEEALKESGLSWVIVRAGGFMRDFAEMAKMAKSGPMYIIGDGTVVSTPVDVRDLARFMADDALKLSDQQVDIGGPEDMTWNQICDVSFEFWGKKPQVIRIPAWLCHALLWPMKFLAPREYALGQMVLFFSLNSVPTTRRGTKTFRSFLQEYYGH